MTDKQSNAIVSQRIEVAPGLVILRVVPQGWELPDFTPGQYAVLGLPGFAARCDNADLEEPPPDPDEMIRRAYSIASSSKAKEYLEFYIALARSGALSPRLFNLNPGDRLWLSTEFSGMFTISDIPRKFNIVLIATGTGVAPYLSMIRSEVSEGLRHRFAVVHGAYHACDLGYHSELKMLDSASEIFSYLPVVSHPKDELAPWTGQEGFVQKIWTDGILDEAWGFHPKPENTHVFLCGNPHMVTDMIELLGKEGFTLHSVDTPGTIHLEEY